MDKLVRKLMLIRHGEKEVVPPPYSVNENGEADKHSLTIRGWERAGALVSFFRFPWSAGIETPSEIYAAGLGTNPLLVEGEDVSKSLRSQQTVTPLANSLGLTLQTKYVVGEEAALATAIKADDGVVLVAWEHKHIPLVAQQFSSDAPGAWPGSDVFDVVWVLQLFGNTYTFTSIPQRLLPGDSS